MIYSVRGDTPKAVVKAAGSAMWRNAQVLSATNVGQNYVADNRFDDRQYDGVFDNAWVDKGLGEGQVHLVAVGAAVFFGGGDIRVEHLGEFGVHRRDEVGRQDA